MKQKLTATAVTVAGAAGIASATFIPSATAAGPAAPYTESTTTAAPAVGHGTTSYPPGTTITAGTGIPVGASLGPGVTVVANKGGTLGIYDNGTWVVIPAGNKFVVASDGTLLTWSQKGSIVTLKLLVKGHNKVDKAYFSTNTTHVVLAHYHTSTLPRYLTFKGVKYRVYQVSKPHGRVWMKLNKNVTYTTFTINTANFKYVHGERALLKREHVTALRTRVKFWAVHPHVYRFTVPIKIKL